MGDHRGSEGLPGAVETNKGGGLGRMLEVKNPDV